MAYTKDGESLIAPLVWTIQMIDLTSNHCRGIRHIYSETDILAAKTSAPHVQGV